MIMSNDELQKFIATLPHELSTYQKDLLTEFAAGLDNLAVFALAGSGKTTTIFQMLAMLIQKRVPASSIRVFAFNTSTRDDANSRLPEDYKVAINSHKYGNAILHDTFNAKLAKNWKTFEIAKRLCNAVFYNHTRSYFMAKKVNEIAEMAMLTKTDFTNLNDLHFMVKERNLDQGINSLQEMMTLLSLVEPTILIGIELLKGANVPALNRIAGTVVKDAGKVAVVTKGLIKKFDRHPTFAEMVFVPTYLNLVVPEHDYVFVDEAQDLNRAQQDLVFASLNPEGRMYIVGDSNQSIYAFAGADPQAFVNMVQRSEAKIMPLNICYRVPENILAQARKVVPDIESHKQGGIFQDGLDIEAMVNNMARGDMVLSRTTAPLLETYFKLIVQEKPAQVLGHDVAKGMLDFLDDIENANNDYEQFHDTADTVLVAKVKKLPDNSFGRTQVNVLHDAKACLMACYINYDEVDDYAGLRKAIKELFPSSKKEDQKRESQMDESVTLMTVHRAKGMERNRVFIIGTDKMPMVHKNQSAVDRQQEWNIIYVALTRAMASCFVEGYIDLSRAPRDNRITVDSVKQSDEKEAVAIPVQRTEFDGIQLPMF